MTGAGAFSEVMDLILDNDCLDEPVKAAEVEEVEEDEEKDIEDAADEEGTDGAASEKPNEDDKKMTEQEIFDLAFKKIMDKKNNDDEGNKEEDKFYEDWYNKFEPQEGKHPAFMSEKQTEDGGYEIVYNFHAISNDLNKECEEWKKCYGYRIGGTYTIKTNPDGESSVILVANITSPIEYDKGAIFGIGFAFPYGAFGSKTEALLIQRTY